MVIFKKDIDDKKKKVKAPAVVEKGLEKPEKVKRTRVSKLRQEKKIPGKVFVHVKPEKVVKLRRKRTVKKQDLEKAIEQKTQEKAKPLNIEVKISPQVLEIKPAPVPVKETVVPAQKTEALPVAEKPKIPVVPQAKVFVAPAPVPIPVLQAPAITKELELNLPITVKDLSIRLQQKPSFLIKILMTEMKMMVGINQLLEEPVVLKICEKFNFKVKRALSVEESVLQAHAAEDNLSRLVSRPPIVTLMGHVDHGKTSLLDAIRKSKVVDSEHGGITQHIGAYRVVIPHGEITFLDTPGHEAFTAMRARGAKITDIVILVVAADDGIMPQTIEAIDHARAAGVSIIVAINKIDKPQADIDRVKKQLSEHNLLAEDWGGKIITVPVSAKNGSGIDDLLEMVLLEAQMLELKTNPDRHAKGVVIEAKISKGRGPVVTLLVQNGTLRLNEYIIVGNFYGKIRAMFNDRGQAVTNAPPAFPVEVLGISGIPGAGEQFFVVDDEKQVKELASRRQEKDRLSQITERKKISLEDLHAQIKEGKIKELKIIIKADVQGSLEAIKQTLEKLNVSEIKLNIIHEGVGSINSSDVILAVASDALILGFNVMPDEPSKELIAKEGVEVKTYNIIYELANEIKAAIEGMLEPKLKKVFLGKAEIKKVFKLSSSGMVAGCMVSKGKILRTSVINIVRNGQIVFEGKISALKRFKDDVREVAEGFECGISVSGFTDLQVGDSIESYGIESIARKLD